LEDKNYRDELTSILVKAFTPAGYQITKSIELGSVPESSKYNALTFTLDDNAIVYRKGNVTPDRPGAFLAVWQRPPSQTVNNNKPVPLQSTELDYLFVQVQEHPALTDSPESLTDLKNGMFIFPVSLLIKKGIVSSSSNKGKTGFRVFPPWSQDRGIADTKVFSESGKKTQGWQLPYFLEIKRDGSIDPCKLKQVFCPE
jgi:hypothetical protein